MAVGDVVSGISASNTLLDFQPAAGVECIVTSSGFNGTANGVQMYDGTLAASGRGATTDVNPIGSLKMFINNTRYLRLPAVTSISTYYSGVVTK